MKYRALTVGVVTLVAVAGCQKNSGGKPSPAEELVIKAVSTQRAAVLDPAVADDPGSRALLPNLYQTLLSVPPGETTPAPDVADCQFDTPTTYRCTVKTGLTFHNGHELDASDVKFSFDRLRTVPGAHPFATIRSIEAKRDDTVVFTLRRPDATFPYQLATPAASVVDQESTPANAVATQDTGSGPYKLGKHAATGPVVLDRFDQYRGGRKPANTRVEITYVADAAAMTKAVRSGAADVATGLPPVAQPPSGLGQVTVPTARIGFWAFRVKAPAVKQVAVRRAVAQLLDREALARRVHADRVDPLYSLLPDGFDGHENTFAETYGTSADRAKASALLRAAGVHTPVRLTIGWNPKLDGAREAAEVRRQLETGGLFKVTVKSGTAADLVQQVRTAEVPDGDSFITPVLRPGGVPAYGYNSPTVTKLIEQEVTGQSQSDRSTAFAGLQRQLASDVPLVPLWQERTALLAGPGVSGADQVLDRMSAVRYSTLRRG